MVSAVLARGGTVIFPEQLGKMIEVVESAKFRYFPDFPSACAQHGRSLFKSFQKKESCGGSIECLMEKPSEVRI
jgi:hypothetical protein